MRAVSVADFKKLSYGASMMDMRKTNFPMGNQFLNEFTKAD